MDYLYKTPRLVGQVLFVVFLFVVLGAQVVSAQDLPPCTESLSDLPEYQDDGDGIEQDVDIDKDNDGLIEICDLEGLYEMRYALDGAGYTTSTMATPNSTGCPTACTGFELTRNLNFTSNGSYRTPANRVIYTVGSGWEPIGTSDNNFNARFEGNGHTISNLRINRRSTNNIGLFGFTTVSANIANIGLPNVRIIGREQVGGLVGRMIVSSVANSYATGSVKGNNQIGGLVGFSDGDSITNSYATSSVEGNENVGGLVGFNSGSITNSYATGTILGDLRVGGLVGQHFRGSITNSYATGTILRGLRVGGLVGFSDGGSITNSYATGLPSLVGVSGFEATTSNSSATTVVQLQTPTTATGIYNNWDPAVWDFGTENDLPTLRNNPEIELIRIRTRVFLEGPLQ